MAFAPGFSDGSPVAGIALMTAASALFACLDASAKYLGETINPFDIVWLRYTAQVLVLALILRVWNHFESFRTERPWMHILRGFHLAGATVCNFWAIRYLQLAEASAIMFCAPLIVTALAGPLLGETIGIRRWIAVVIGFVGVLIVTRPGTGAMHWAVLLSFAAVFNYSMYSILTRRMNKTESAESLLMLSALVGVVGFLPFAPSAVTSLEGWHWGLAAMMGVFGAAGHYALVVAHRIATASTVAPFIYTQMVWMILFGYLIFGDVPDFYTILGTAIIAAAGLYILHREQVRGQTVAPREPAAQ